jgi:hypothetical protein
VSLELDVVQQWFQAVITHPEGVAGGLASEAAQERLAVSPESLAEVILPSRQRTAEERLSIYAHAYYSRLLECLADSFPLLARALGEEVFQSFAFEYLQAYPSRSYTLDRLGESFPRFLEETRPDREAPDSPSWPDFLIDLARFDQALVQVFDGPGVEGQELLGPEAIAGLGPERFATSRLEAVPCLRLLDFRFPVNAYFSAVRQAGEDEEVPIPDPAPEHVALTRTDWVVRRFTLTATQHRLLEALLEGETVADAVARAAEAQPEEKSEDAFVAEVQEAFRMFAAQGFFRAVVSGS